MRKLTDKQKLFVKEYLIDLNATQATIRAGYSKTSANQIATELLGKTVVINAIQKAMDKRSERTEITADYVLNGIKETIERCVQAKPVLDSTGNPVMIETDDGSLTPAYKFDASNALKGYELLGKHLKLFTDKQEIDHLSSDGSMRPTTIQLVTPEYDGSEN